LTAVGYDPLITSGLRVVSQLGPAHKHRQR